MTEQSKTVTGPRWIVEVDDLSQNALIGADFDTLEEVNKFHDEHPGNWSRWFLPEGRTATYWVFKPLDLKGIYQKAAEELRQHGTDE